MSKSTLTMEQVQIKRMELLVERDETLKRWDIPEFKRINEEICQLDEIEFLDTPYSSHPVGVDWNYPSKPHHNDPSCPSY